MKAVDLHCHWARGNASLKVILPSSVSASNKLAPETNPPNLVPDTISNIHTRVHGKILNKNNVNTYKWLHEYLKG